SPSTPAERAVIERTRRFAMIVGGIAAGIPLLLIIVSYIALIGNYYHDVSPGQGSGERVVVRSGRAGLSAFHWLPPGFGDVEADTGFSRAMIAPDRWADITDNELGGGTDDGTYVRQVLGALRPTLRGLIEYAATGSETSLSGLINAVKSPEDAAALLAELVPIARGLPAEVAFVEAAVADPSPAVQSSALTLAAAAELRRLAFAVVRGLGDEAAQALYKEALALDPQPAARRELLGLITTDTGVAAPAASTALAMLSQKGGSDASRSKARALLRRAF